MTHLSTNDANLGHKLETATTPLVLLDARGAVIGRFMPEPEHQAVLAGLECPYTE